MANQSELSVLVTGKDELSPQFDRIESKLIRFVGAIGASLAAIRIGSAPIVAAAEFERELANVKKTTDFLPASMKQLEAGLLSLSTRVNVSAKDLAKIAAEAGQQGLGRYGVEGVLQFTDSVARMSSVLDITATDAANDIGKIVNIFKIPLSEIEKAVSQFNEVSNTSTAKGGELLDVVKRIGDAAGTLKGQLGSSIALAATGLDFGQSPEVVGTAYSKMFTTMVQKSDTFSRLVEKNLKRSGKEWAEGLQTDGLGAFKTVLEALRKLTPQAQADTVTKLFGGGRIGALTNKLIQDTTNSVLERNIAAAAEGAKGTSAIREQATVLNTLKEQTKLAQNALVKAGIEATESVLSPLTALAVGVRQVFESAEFRLILRTIVDDVKAFAGAVKDTVGFLAGLNVNWGNFLNLARLFIGLKIVSFIGNLAGVLASSALGLKSVAQNGAGAAAALKNAEAATSVSATRRAAELVGLQHIYDAIQRNKAAELQAAQVKRDLTLKQQQLDAASARTTATAGVARNALGIVGAESQRVSEAKNNVQTAIQAAQQQELSNRQARAARIEAAEQAHQARLAAIQQDYETRRAAIRATGTETGLKALRAERTQLIAEQEATHTRSLRGIESYWARRMAADAAGSQAAINAQRAAQMQALGKFDAAVNTNNAAGNLLGAAQSREDRARTELAASRANAAAAAATNGILAAQAGALAMVRGAWTATIGVWNVAKATIGSVGTAVVGLASKMLTAFTWVTLIYSVADAFGLIDKITPSLQRFTDFLGLTSEKSRQGAVEQEVFNEKLRQQKIELDAVTESYRKMAAERGGAISAEQLKADVTIARTAESTDSRTGAVNRIADLAVGASTERDNALFNRGGADGIRQQQELQKQIDVTKRKITELKEQSKRATEGLAEGSPQFVNRQKTFDGAIARTTAELATYEKKLADLRASFPPTSEAVQQAERNFATIAGVLASFQTKESIDAMEKFLVPLADARQELKDMNEQLTLANTKAAAGVGGAASMVAEFTKKVEDANTKVNGLKTKFLEFLGLKQQDKTLPPAVAQSLQDLTAFQERDTRTLKTIIQAGRTGKATGENAGVVKGAGQKSTGNETFDVKENNRKKMDLARRLRAAEIELAKAQSEAEASLKQQQNARLQALDDDAYAKGLRAIDQYFADRLARQQSSLDAEIRQRETDIRNVQASQADPGADAAEKKRMEADIVKLRGQLAVLRDRKKQLNDDSKRDATAAKEQFDLQTLQLASNLADEGFIPRSAEQRFKAKLAGMMEEAKVQFAKLRTQGEAGQPVLNDVGLALERQLRARAAAAAVAPDQEAFGIRMNQLNVARTNLSALASDGQLIGFELEKSVDKYIAAALPELAKFIDSQQKILDGMVGLEATPAYQNLKLQIENARISLRGMALETEATARAINQSVTGSLTNAITSFDFTFKGLLKSARTFLSDIAKNIQGVFAQNIAQSWMRSINSGGSGGVGGFVSGLMGKAFPTGNVPDGTDKNPLNVKLQSNGVGPDATNGIGPTTQDPADLPGLIWDKLKSGFGGIVDNFRGIFGDFGSTFDGIFGGFGQLFLSGISTLVTALFTSAAASTASSSAGFIAQAAQVAAVVAHTGGVIGSSGLQQRIAAPGMFRNALSYHTGGVVGLKPNEVPIIGLKGEEMLTESDPRHRKNLGKGGSSQEGPSGSGTVNVWVVTQDQMPAAGPNDIVAVVSDNISRGGSIKKLIQQVNLGAV